MGQTLAAWTGRVQSLLKDSAGLDADATLAQSVGVVPALAQFSIDRPRLIAVDIAASGRYLPFPTEAQGWQEAFSTVLRVEAPAGQTPPQVLDPAVWSATRDPLLPGTARLLLPSDVSGVTCRVVFYGAWPTPGVVAADDLLSPVAFSAVTSLAAAMVLTALAAEAARDRQGAMPTDFVDGNDRARSFLDAAAANRVIYNTFIGLGSVSGSSSSAGSRVLRAAAVGSQSQRMSAATRRQWWDVL